VITLAMGTEIAAPRVRVWEALTETQQLRHWRPGVEAELGAARGGGDRLEPHRTLRFRCRLHDLPVVLAERPLAMLPPTRLRSALSLGLFHFEETFTLASVDPDGRRTRLRIKIATQSEMPLLGGSLNRFAVRRFSTQLAATTLAALRDWCERCVPLQAQLPDPPLAAQA